MNTTPFQVDDTVAVTKNFAHSIFAVGEVLTVRTVHNDGTVKKPKWCIYANNSRGGQFFPIDALTVVAE